MPDGYVIRREVDDKFSWYGGTTDRKPQFGSIATIFKTEADAERRTNGLRRQEPGTKFEVIPR